MSANSIHLCTQEEKIGMLVISDRKQSNALFGNEDDGVVGIVEDVKAMRKLLEEMKPTYKELNDWGTFFQKGKRLGLGLASIITIFGIIVGGLYAIKGWIMR